MIAANYIAYTAPINPSSATRKLTLAQVWHGLEIKITSGETFVPGAIEATTVLKTYETSSKPALPVTEREVLFRADQRRVHETCISYKPMKVEFHQKDGSRVMNIISQGAGGEEDLYMTYSFEWLHPEAEGDEEKVKEKRKPLEEMAKKAVEGTIEVMRELAEKGTI
jgi:hypothetical protein